MASRERFLIVNFAWKSAPKVEEIKPIFNTALDWYRMGSSVWVLWTTSSPDAWYAAIRSYMTEEDSVFIAELNLSVTSENYFGWQTKSFWNWLDKHRA
jgi:hypothetical protein